MGISGISSSLAAIRAQSAAIDRAAERVSRAGLNDVPTAGGEAAPESAVLQSSGQDPDLVDGMVGMLVAKRMFTAAIHTAQSMNEAMFETVKLGGYGIES